MKKRLLNEETTRRFMKLANLGGLSETFVTETEKELEETSAVEEETLEETYMEEEDPEMPDAAPEMDMGDDLEGDPEMDLDDELPPEDPEMDLGDEAPAGDLDASAVINAVAQATLDALKGQGLVSDETTVAVDDAGDPGDDLGAEEELPLPEPEMDMDADPGLDDAAPLEDEEEMMEQTDALEEEEVVEELETPAVALEADDAFISEIVRRVAERILAAKKANS